MKLFALAAAVLALPQDRPQADTWTLVVHTTLKVILEDPELPHEKTECGRLEARMREGYDANSRMSVKASTGDAEFTFGMSESVPFDLAKVKKVFAGYSLKRIDIAMAGIVSVSKGEHRLEHAKSKTKLRLMNGEPKDKERRPENFLKAIDDWIAAGKSRFRLSGSVEGGSTLRILAVQVIEAEPDPAK